MDKQKLKALEELLDDRWYLATKSWLNSTSWLNSQQAKNTLPDFIYYNGVVASVEAMGIEWTRNEQGKHKLFI